MKLGNVNLSIRITASALIVVATGALALLHVENTRDRNDYLNEQKSHLEKAADTEKSRLTQAINTLCQDVVFLSNTPPISGIMRAVQNHGYDPRYGNTYQAWVERLQQTFSAFSRAHPSYFKIRFIGVADEGREIVRIDNRNGRIEAIPANRLQTKGSRDFFKAALALHEGQVHISEFNLNQDWGAIEKPYWPTLRAVTPVFTESGRIFGMVVINIDAATLLKPSTPDLPNGALAYIADGKGHYLLHPDSTLAFTFELGDTRNLTTDFPSLGKMFGSGTADYLAMQEAATRAGHQYIAAKRIHFDPSDPSRFILLAYAIPHDVMAQQIPSVPLREIVGGFLAMLLVSAIAMYVLRRMFAPLETLTEAANRIAAGRQKLPLSYAGGGEIGSLTNALNTMLSGLSEREQEILKLNAELEERVKERTKELEQAHIEIEAALRRYRTLMRTSMDGIHIMDIQGNLVEANDAFFKMLGYCREDAPGLNVADWEAHYSPEQLRGGFKNLIGKSKLFETLHRRKDGTVINVEVSVNGVEMEGLGLIFATSRDITARKKAEEEIHHLAFYDTLTRLPNRRLFFDRFHAALTASARHNDFGAVLFIDLDRFKLLNDTLGHDYGDLLLTEVASRIKSCVREMDTVARLGGDEFVVLIEAAGTKQEEALPKISLVAEKIRESLAQPYCLNGHAHHSSPSIGVSLYQGNEETEEELLRHADMAMYQAKDSGRNAVHFFDPVMQNKVAMHAALVNDLRNAIAMGQLHLYYQLQVDNNNRPVGAEALLRWVHPLRGTVMPEQFIPLAEESTLILDIGDWVLDAACHQLASWRNKPETSNLILTVNLSAKQFTMPDFVSNVERILRTHQINPMRLKLELTESMALDDLESSVEKMHALKALGVCLSMDDFGTRYSTLSSLKLLPLDQLKLGRSFVRDIASDGNVALLVQNIIDLSSKCRITVVAEGVENQAQLASLKDRDCVSYQGFLFSKAIPAEDFERLLRPP